MGQRFSGLQRRTPHVFPIFLTGFHRRLSCLTSISVFHPGGGGGSTPTFYAQHMHFSFFFKHFSHFSCYRAHHRTPNTMSISTMNSHPCHVMSYCIMQCNHAIAYSYHATYMMSVICACLHMHNYLCIIQTFISKSIKISYISYNSCHHINTHIH